MCIYISKRNPSTNYPTKGQKHSYFFFFIEHITIMENILKICGFMDFLLPEKIKKTVLNRLCEKKYF
tara:strand:- start:728 stop:928 length:201 start_codon:yes stop_codon:yes gene_type:complete